MQMALIVFALSSKKKCQGIRQEITDKYQLNKFKKGGKIPPEKSLWKIRQYFYFH